MTLESIGNWVLWWVTYFSPPCIPTSTNSTYIHTYIHTTQYFSQLKKLPKPKCSVGKVTYPPCVWFLPSRNAQAGKVSIWFLRNGNAQRLFRWWYLVSHMSQLLPITDMVFSCLREQHPIRRLLSSISTVVLRAGPPFPSPQITAFLWVSHFDLWNFNGHSEGSQSHLLQNTN